MMTFCMLCVCVCVFEYHVCSVFSPSAEMGLCGQADESVLSIIFYSYGAMAKKSCAYVIICPCVCKRLAVCCRQSAGELDVLIVI